MQNFTLHRHMKGAKQGGFSIVAAIFLIVTLASIGLYMVRISSVQHTTNLFTLQGAKAYYSARSGLDWGIATALNNAACFADTTFTISNGNIPFSVTVSCNLTAGIAEQTTAIPIYNVTATALAAGYNLTSTDYVSRELSASVSINPP